MDCAMKMSAPLIGAIKQGNSMLEIIRKGIMNENANIILFLYIYISMVSPGLEYHCTVLNLTSQVEILWSWKNSQGQKVGMPSLRGKGTTFGGF